MTTSFGGKTWKTSALERFLRYVVIDTQSQEDSQTYPSTDNQYRLLHLLADELQLLGLDDVGVDEYGYVFATIPATTTKADVPVLGFLAHVDTSPEMPGADVRPLVHRDYHGQDLVLPDDPSAVLRLRDTPLLAEQIGHDIVTASGTTLLGADNKAGVAEIMAATEYLLTHPEISHGRIRIGFTPDEEVGAGTRHFDVKRFGATYAYTVDGESLGEIESESFCADAITIAFHGFNTHPGYAKGKMINAIKVAADFIARLPRNELSPETTEGHEGYVHPYVIHASVEQTTVKLLVRDFEPSGLQEKEALLERLAVATVGDWPGLTVRERPIRGGTDGCRLSFMGLPPPNIFAGEHNFHSKLEWVSVQDMEKAVEVIVNLVRIWDERSFPAG